MAVLMRKMRVPLATVAVAFSLAGCWDDASRVGAEYEAAWLAAHPDAAMLGDVDAVADAMTDAATTDALDALDAADAPTAADAPDVFDAPDADLCALVVCTPPDPCQSVTCDSATGKCGPPKNLPDTTPCKDDSACTTDDKCAAGHCAGLLLQCDDQNFCTDDSCDAAKGCVHLANTATCSDGSLCTTNDTCKNAACGGSTLNCNDSNPCTTDGCDAQLGCLNAPNTATCTDNDACTEVDKCANGVCGGGKVDCDDANACTGDACDLTTGCTHAKLQGTCDDGNPCTLPDLCVSGACQGSSYAFGLHITSSGMFDSALGIVSGGGKTWLVGSSAAAATAQSDFALWAVGADGSIGAPRLAGDSTFSESGHLAAPATGGVWVVGDASSSTAAPRPSFAWFGDDGTNSVYKFPSTDLSWRITGRADVGGQWLLIGNRQASGEPLHGWLGLATAKSGAQPSVILTADWPASVTKANRLDALVTLASGALLGIGSASNAAGGDDLWLVKVGATGAVDKEFVLDIGAGAHRVISGLAMADGGVLVLAMADDLTPATLNLIRLDKNLGVAWQRPLGVDLWQSAVLVAATSGAYIVGTRADTLDRGAVIRVNEEGQTLWSYTLPVVGQPQRLTGAILQADGRLVAYGWQGSADADLLELGLDQWGSASCTLNGSCTSLGALNADDLNPCTLDKCDAVLGVVHTPVADGSWCENGVDCTVADTCVSGTCIGGPRFYTKNFSGRTLYGMEVVNTGGFVLCGSTNDAIGSSYITWVDAAGKQKVDNVGLGTTPTPGHGCVQAVDDAIWQAGWSGAGNAEGARIRKFDLSANQVVFDKSYQGVQFTTLVAHPQGGVVALGSNQPAPRATRILADGSLAWDWLGTGAGNADNANAAVFLNDGSLLVVGERHANGAAPAAFAVRLDASGKAIWTQNFVGTIGRLNGAAVQPDGAPIAVGAQGQGGTATAWIVRFDFTTGAVKDSLSPPSAPGTVWYDVAFFPPGNKGLSSDAAFLVGSAGSQAVFARVLSDTFAGKPESLSASGQGPAPAYRSVVLDPSGDVVLAGNTTQAQFVRMDAWYHQSCTTGSQCLGVAPTGCDDSNPCTQDDCDVTFGCKHSPGPPNQPCPGGMCQNGVCK